MEIPFGDWKLRTPTMDDAESIAKYANNRNVSRNLRDAFPYPYHIWDAYAWLGRVTLQDPAESLMIISDEESIGGISVMPRGDVERKTAELGYWLAEPFWGRGIMTGAVSTMVEYAFSTFDFVRIEAKVFESNIGSARVLEKSGFVQEARLRKAVVKEDQIMDEYVYALVR